jgi:hypothetical protein
MRTGEYLAYYLRSPLGIGSIVGTVGLATLGIALGAPVLPSLAAGLGLAVLSNAVAFLSGVGAKGMVAARSAKEELAVSGRIGEAERLREKLSRLRVADPQVSAALGSVILSSGEYLESCKKVRTYDPAANHAMESALEIANIFLAELNEASVERRFSLEDADPFVDSRARVVAALKEKSLALREGRTRIEGGLSARDRMAIEEELK